MSKQIEHVFDLLFHIKSKSPFAPHKKYRYKHTLTFAEMDRETFTNKNANFIK